MKETFLLVCGCLQTIKTQPAKMSRHTVSKARTHTFILRMELMWYVVR